MENKDILNFGKVRLSYANVGSDEDPYNLAFKYTPASTYFLQYLGDVNTFPHMGLVGFTGPRVLPNENLKNSSTVCLFEANVASRSHLKSRVSTGVNPKVTSTPLLAIFPGLYGDISLGYKDMLFVNVTGRNDWSSTLPINNRSYFYPSISAHFHFSIPPDRDYAPSLP